MASANTNTNSDPKKKKKKKKNTSTAILIVLIVILVILLAIVFLLTRSKPEENTPIDFNQVVDDPNDDEEDETVDPNAPTLNADLVNSTLEASEDFELTQDEGWHHYLLLGVDGETDSYKGKRSDAMIVLSVSEEEKRVVLSSVPRDTLVYIDGKGFDKLTHAYAYGGAALTVQTFEENFDIDIENYFTINFKAMEEMVDLLGGLELTLTDKEAEHMGDYYAAWGLKGGTQILDGAEVLAYCRVRKIDSDYKRNDRQYRVLMAIYDEVKDMPASKYTGMLKTVYDHMNTDMMVADAIELVGTLLDITKESEIENVKLVDSDHSKTGRYNSKSVVLVDNLVDTADRWREALGIEDYTPSKRLQQISDRLESMK
ncbi:MAG: LCP family protein [Lachnospiraceae bacterium]|jgi:LCP family protein required for cell wall assembly|nr:LCP family protein [Lachnospiraceae bacterium]